MRLQQLGGRRRLVVELRDVAVALRIIVVGIDDHLAGQGRDRYLSVVLQRHADDDNVACGGGLIGRSGASPWTELLYQIRQRVGSARVADHDIVSVRHGEPRNLTADVARSDQSDRCHGAIIERTCPMESARPPRTHEDTKYWSIRSDLK